MRRWTVTKIQRGFPGILDLSREGLPQLGPGVDLGFEEIPARSPVPAVSRGHFPALKAPPAVPVGFRGDEHRHSRRELVGLADPARLALPEPGP